MIASCFCFILLQFITTKSTVRLLGTIEPVDNTPFHVFSCKLRLIGSDNGSLKMQIEFRAGYWKIIGEKVQLKASSLYSATVFFNSPDPWADF